VVAGLGGKRYTKDQFFVGEEISFDATLQSYALLTCRVATTFRRGDATTAALFAASMTAWPFDGFY
jgi:hypothetical protein